MEMDLFWRTVIKFYGVPTIGMDFFISLFETHAHTHMQYLALHSQTYCNCVSIGLESQPTFFTDRSIHT